MKIAKDTVVTIRFKLSETNGTVLWETREPAIYLHGGYGNVFPKIEEAVEGREAGYATTLTLAPEDAFGKRDEALAPTVPLSEFPPGVTVGTVVNATSPEGVERQYRIVKMEGEEVLLDANHPHADKTVSIALKVESVREATGEEIEHQHVHGEGGHHH